MPLFAAAGNESAVVPHDEEEYEEVDEMTSSIDPITMISARVSAKIFQKFFSLFWKKKIHKNKRKKKSKNFF